MVETRESRNGFMKAFTYRKYGTPEVLHLEEVEKPVPNENELLIKIGATTVTSGDVRLRKADPFIVRFLTGLLRPKYLILGLDFAGVVESVGNSVRNFQEGDPVFGTSNLQSGTYAEYICLSEDAVLTKKPDTITNEEAAAIFFGGHAALYFLKKGGIKSGQKVLIYGASGALGTYGVQLAKYFGAEVAGVCSGANVELVKTLGADTVIDYTRDDFTKTGPYDIIFDTIGKSPFLKSIRTLKKNGSYLRAVNISLSAIVQGLWMKLTSRKKVIGGVAHERIEDLVFLKDLVVSGKITPVIDRTYSLEQMVEAHSYVEKGHKKGNVVITVAHPDKP